jgi:hypothetical protein
VNEQAAHVRGPESLLDDLLPRFDVRQVHEASAPAPVAAVYSAVKQVTGREVRVLMPRCLPLSSKSGGSPTVPDIC